MSQENSYYQVQSVQAARTPSYAESVASIVRDLMHTTPAQITASAQIIQNAHSISLSPSSVQTLQSPTSLKVLQKHFNQNIATLKCNNAIKCDEVTKIKAAAIMTMQQENLMVENKGIVAQSVRELMKATTINQATEKLTATFTEIKNQHSRVFTNTLSSTIQLASSKVGFTSMKSEIVSPNLTRVVATNSKGYNLISEIHTDEKKKVDIVSELEGITDGSCKKIIEDFNRELETFGIVAERKERKPTGGIAQMPYAKKLQKQRNTFKREFVNEQVISMSNKDKLIQHINN